MFSYLKYSTLFILQDAVEVRNFEKELERSKHSHVWFTSSYSFDHVHLRPLKENY